MPESTLSPQSGTMNLATADTASGNRWHRCGTDRGRGGGGGGYAEGERAGGGGVCQGGRGGRGQGGQADGLLMHLALGMHALGEGGGV
jgi:hypothetical protein